MNPGTPTHATIPLPQPIQRALNQIAAELNDMPRECARDHGALCLWKGRLARQIRGIMQMRVQATALRLPAPAPPPAIAPRGRGKTGKRKAQDVRTRQLEMRL